MKCTKESIKIYFFKKCTQFIHYDKLNLTVKGQFGPYKKDDELKI